jgi:Tfp pilus assembly protein PilF
VKPFIPSESVDEHVLLASARVQLARRPGTDHAARRAAMAALDAAAAKAQAAPGAKADQWAALGALREMIEDPAGAEPQYRTALRLDPNHTIGQNNLAMLILRRGGDLSEARDLATGAASNADHPAAAEILDTLAQVETKLGHHDAAADALRRAALLQPNNLATRVGLVEALLDAGKPAEARGSLMELEELMARTASVDPAQSSRIDQVRQRLASLPGK